VKVMIDTNVLISAILKEGSLLDIVVNEVAENQELILCDYIIKECYEVALKRFPSKVKIIDKLLTKLRYELIAAPRFGEIKINDVKDQPILNAAIEYCIDVLITGDKHFLNLGIPMPEICSPSEYKKKYID
jgi:putative PIN family toxin of toxin-antitoxin system